jgi:hypothetical protein
MEKKEFLKQISEKLNSGEITKEEIFQELNIEQATEKPAQEIKSEKTNNFKNNFSPTKMLYILGTVVVIIGIIIFVEQIWGDIGTFSRIFITLGIGLIFALNGSILFKQKSESMLGPIFHFIAGILIPIGIGVYFVEFQITSEWIFAFTSLMVFIFYLILNFVHKHSIFTFFSIIFGTATIYLFTNAIIINTNSINTWTTERKIYKYLTLIMGINYLLLAKNFYTKWHKIIINLLFFFGSFGFLLSAFTLIFDNDFWLFSYPLFVFAGFYSAIYMKSKNILFNSTLFLIIYTIYITGKYFANSLGWPITLIFLGFIFISLGYFSLTINKKYLK